LIKEIQELFSYSVCKLAGGDLASLDHLIFDFARPKALLK